MYLPKTKPTKKQKFIYLKLNQSMLGSFNSTNKYNDIKRIVYLPLPNWNDRRLHWWCNFNATIYTQTLQDRSWNTFPFTSFPREDALSQCSYILKVKEEQHINFDK